MSFQSNASMERLSIVTVVFLRKRSQSLALRGVELMSSSYIHRFILWHGKLAPFPPSVPS
jgi:hypothetical protein